MSDSCGGRPVLSWTPSTADPSAPQSSSIPKSLPPSMDQVQPLSQSQENHYPQSFTAVPPSDFFNCNAKKTTVGLLGTAKPDRVTYWIPAVLPAARTIFARYRLSRQRRARCCFARKSRKCYWRAGDGGSRRRTIWICVCRRNPL